MEQNKELNTDKQCDIHVVIPRFSINTNVKTIVSKNADKIYREERKGSKGVIEKIGKSLNKICYWVNFGDHHSWIEEDYLNVV